MQNRYFVLYFATLFTVAACSQPPALFSHQVDLCLDGKFGHCSMISGRWLRD